MEAATRLPFSQVRVAGGRLWIDGLVVDDEAAVRLAAERTEAGEDIGRLVADAIAIGARVLDREQAGAHADFVKAEFERAARDLDSEFVDRARKVAERLDARIDDVFGPENGHMTKTLARHFGDESSVAVQNRVKSVLAEVSVQMREDLRKQFSSDSENNPLATFQKMTLAAMHQGAQRQATQLETMTEALAKLREDVVRLQGEKERLEEVAAEADRGTAKGRTLRGGGRRRAGDARRGAGRRLRARRRPRRGHRQEGRRRRVDRRLLGPDARPHRLRGQEQAPLAPRGHPRARPGAWPSATPTTPCSSSPPTRRCRRRCRRCASTTATS